MNTYLLIICILVAIILGLLVIIYFLWRQTHRLAPGLDEVAEDSLKALYYLSRNRPAVPDSDLIRAADLQPSRYPLIAAELKQRGWAVVDAKNLRILPAGEKRALELIRAHRIWERYLLDKEGVSLDSLHDQAMHREHLSTAEEIDRLEAELGFPKFDPHGDPIPRRGDENAVAVEEGTPLSRWELHKLGRIVHVEDEPPALFSQLVLLGLTPGAQVEVDEHTPGRVLVWSGRHRQALAPAAADLVTVVETHPERAPLSEIETGQAARVAAFDPTFSPENLAIPKELKAGVEITALKTDPLGDPVTYRLDGKVFTLTHVQANRILIDVTSIHEIPVSRRHWLAEEVEHFKELWKSYGGWAAIKRGLLLLGPAFIVSVGYMDPGNWGTDIEAGARFGYRLLWVILLANLMAILLHILSVKLGIATGKSLPEVCRDRFPRWVSVLRWATAEIAAMATDLAEFLGGAMGFYLLFHIPLFPAALLTGGVISLILLLERYGYRKVEMVVIGLISIIGFVYLTEIWLSKPAWGSVIAGFKPSIPIGASLVLVGIIGATVMPHNLYLHSALIQTRVRPGDSLERKKKVFRFSILDSVVALNGAFFVNAAILSMSAAVFSGGRLSSYSLESAHQTLTPLLGSLAGAAFAIALLASGLSSSTTATMAGQVVMEGFLHHKMNVWLRRAVTMIPSLIVIGLGIDPLQILVLSQVSLSFQLPFAIVPLLLFTNNREIMGDFVNSRWIRILAWIVMLIIFSLNIVLIVQIFSGKA